MRSAAGPWWRRCLSPHHPGPLLPSPPALPHREKREKLVQECFSSPLSRCGRGVGSGERGWGSEGRGGGTARSEKSSSVRSFFSRHNPHRVPRNHQLLV